MRKSLSVLLTLCMLISLIGALPLTVSAAASIELAEPVESGAKSVVFNTSGAAEKSWIAIYAGTEKPSNNSAYIDYVYVSSDGATATFPSNSSIRMKDATKWPLGGGINAGTYVVVLFDAGYTVLAQQVFTVTGEPFAATSFSIDTRWHTVGEEVVFTYANSVSDKDWIGIYPEGSTAYGNNWSYTVGESGQVSFKNLAAGKYTAKYFSNGRSDAESLFASIDFRVAEEGGLTSFSIEKTEYTVGETVVFTYKNSESDKDWIGIYPEGSTAYGNNWSYTVGESGQVSFKNLAAGKYTAKYFENEKSSADALFASIDFTVVGEDSGKPTFAIEKTEYTVGETVVFTYKNGKTDKDWIGIYPEGATTKYIAYEYAKGGSGSVSFKNLAAGKYTAKYFENEKSSEDALFGTLDFTVVGEDDAKPSVTVNGKVSAGATSGVGFTVKGYVGGSWVALYYQSRNIENARAAYDDYVDVKSSAVNFPSNDKQRQRYEFWPLGGGITAGNWTAVLYDSGYGELARTTFTVADDSTSFAPDKTIYFAGDTVTFTYKNSHYDDDFIAVYAENDETTILEQKNTVGESGSVSFTGSWTEKVGTYLVKYYENGSTDVVLATSTVVLLDDDVPEAGDGVYFMMYGGNGDGRDPEDPAGNVDTVIDAINADGYAEGDDVILYVMDAPDAFTYRPVSQGRGQTPSHLTAWGNPKKAHTATLHVKGYLGTRSHIVTQQKFGDYASATVTGPVVFEDITFVRSRRLDEGMAAGGFKITVTPETVIKSYPSDFGNVGEVWDGTLSDVYMTFILGSDASCAVQGDNPRVDITNRNSNGAEFYFASWYEKHSVYTKPATLAIYDLKGDCTIWYTGANDVTFKKSANILVGEAPEMTGFQLGKGPKTAVHEGAFAFIVNKNNKAAADYTLPDWITAKGGIYRMNVEADLLDFTENDGVFYCTDPDKIALAVDSEGVQYYSDDEGFLTVLPGTYDVSFIDASEMEDKIVTVFCGNNSYTAYRGSFFTLPTILNTPFKLFKGYTFTDASGETHTYAGGDRFMIPDDGKDFYIIKEVWEEIPDVVGVYLSANGSDSADGSNRNRAVRTFDRAYELIKDMDGEKKMIVITGTYPFTGKLPENTEMITITGDGTGTSVLDLNDNYIVMCGPVTLENIILSETNAGNGKYFATYGNELVIGEGVTQAEKPLALRFGTMNPTDGLAKKETATLKSGTFGNIALGAFYVTRAAETAGADIVIDGADVAGISLVPDGWLDTHRGNYFTEDVRITVKSGSLGAVSGALGDPTTSRSVAFTNGAKLFVLVNNSRVKTTLTDFSAYCPAGAWSVYCDNANGGSLSYTDTDGVYRVNGAKYALATSSDGKQYLSDNGLLTLPSGAYSVELTDTLLYLFDGKVITVYNPCTLDLSNFTADSEDGKLFLGWTLSDGTPAKNVDTYKAGDTITATYIDYTTGTSGDFFIKGAQIRTEGEQGLRFVLEKKNEFCDKLPEIIDFGALVLPTEYTHGHDMKYGEEITNEYAKALPAGVETTTWEYNKPAVVKADKLYKETKDGVQYTLCITGIDPTKYYRHYSVKGYLRYRDLNGNDKVLYTDYYQTNLYNVALAALDAGETPAETFEGIKKYVEVDRMEAYMKENYDGRTPLADAKNNAAKSWRDTEGSANIKGVTNKDYYALKNGLKIREVEFDFNTSGTERKDITIVHFADTHLNALNDKDWEEADPCILSTYRGRSWNRDGSSVAAINSVMEYASFFDKTIATGDLMDYFSWGCAEMIQKLMIDRDKGMIPVIGNHEPARLMEADNPSLKDNMSLEDKYARIQSVWPTDIKYYSEILKNDDGDNMVMVIAMDNERYGYWEEQIEPLKADIEKARALGIKILFFQHTPICTIPGGGEDWVTYFYEPGDTSGMTEIDGVKHTNFGASNFAGSATKYSGATKTVYDLITGNADVVAGLFCGDWHVNMYTEIHGKTPSGEEKLIPQYIVTANAYSKGSAIKITIK